MTAISRVAKPGEQGDAERVALNSVVVRPREQFGQLVMSERVVQHQLERPGCREAHGDLDQHCDKYDKQPAAVRPNEPEHQTGQLLILDGCWVLRFRGVDGRHLFAP